MSKEVPHDVKQFIRAVLISAQNGIRQTNFGRDYRKYTDTILNWRQLGFSDLLEFLLAIPDVARVEYSPKDNENLVFGVPKKDVYSSEHAKKAANKRTGLPARPPSEWGKSKGVEISNIKGRMVNVTRDSSSLKVTVSVSKTDASQIVPNLKGLYGLHVSNLPPMCTQQDMLKAFGTYKSLREVKMLTTSQNRAFAFAKYAKLMDAAQALKEMDGYVLKGCKLRVKPANEGSASKTTTTSKSISNETTSVKKIQTLEKVHKAGVGEPALTSQRQDKSPASTGNLSDPSAEDGLVIEREQDGYPLHISFFPPNPSFTELQVCKLFSKYGVATKVVIKERYALVFYATRKEAVLTLQNMKRCNYDSIQMTVSTRIKKPDDLKNVTAALECITEPSRPSSSGSASSSSSGIHNHNTMSVLSESRDTGYGSGDSSNDILSNTMDCINHGNQTKVRLTEESYPLGSGAIKQDLEMRVHLILSRDEMDILVKASGHHGQRTYDVLPDELDILVTEVVDSCHFWAIIDDGSNNWKRLEEIREQLQEINVQPVPPKKHLLGAAKFTEDCQWYRCLTLDVSADRQYIKVLYVDYGNAEWVAVQQFTCLDEKFWTLLPQANPFKLAGLEPAGGPSTERGKSGSRYLNNMICDRKCKAKKCPNTNPLQPHVLELELFVTGDQNSANNHMADTDFVRRVKKDQLPLNPPPSPKKLFEINKLFKIWITWVETPEKIFFQYAMVETRSLMDLLELLLLQIPLTAKVFPRPGWLACLIQHDGRRARVLIREIVRFTGVFQTINEVLVYHVDIGRTERVYVNNLLEVSQEISNIPFQANVAQLAGVRQNVGFWSQSAKQILLDKRTEVIDASIVKQYNKYSFDLELFDVDGVSLNLKILEAERAALNMKKSPSRQSLSSVDSNGSEKNLNTPLDVRKSHNSVRTSESEDWEKHVEDSHGKPPISPKSPQQLTSNETSIKNEFQGASGGQNPVMHYNAPTKAQPQHLESFSQSETVSGFSMPMATTSTRVHDQVSPQPVLPAFREQSATTMQSKGFSMTGNQPGAVGMHSMGLISDKQKSTTAHSLGFYMPPPPSEPVATAKTGGSGSQVQGAGMPPVSTSQPRFSSPNTMRTGEGTPYGVDRTSRVPTAQQGPNAVPISASQSEGGIPNAMTAKAGWSSPHAGTGGTIQQQGSSVHAVAGTPQGTSTHVVQASSSYSIGQHGLHSPTPTTIQQGGSHMHIPPAKVEVSKQPLIENLVGGNSQSGFGQNISKTASKETGGGGVGRQTGGSFEEWKKEKESLLGKRGKQEMLLKSLGEELSKPVDFSKMKERLEKEIRVTEIENRVIKLRKEIDQLEATKAQLQLQLLNS